ncbi:flagellar biosynthetic protein FliP [Paracoccus aurantiacus]|uniref:Flagellar biosynthetic protein FliP n=2 Tax=Paracoccus aurantiacus TaxID=2599412 RepID=A0A5C6S2V7_9RHOB|nr:flagellar biosynthetic protein FliP [Paracoccus aurantiacus]
MVALAVLIATPLQGVAQSVDVPLTTGEAITTTDSATGAQAANSVAEQIGSVVESIATGSAEGSGVGQTSILLFLGLTVLSLAPAIAITVTCFPFMVTVLSILRQSLGLQQSPPNMLIVSLALFLTWFVMDPVLREAWSLSGPPLQSGQIGLIEALSRAIGPFERFMAARADPAILDEMRSLVPADAAGDGLRLLIPSFMLTELQRAFEIGFLIALPFLVIDLVVSAVLMAMGMMMVPPAVVALPFKLAFFVVVDGWVMLSAALVRGYQ